MGGLGPGEAKEWGALGHEAARLLEEMPKPTIAAINGFALGGGCELALGCDLRYASSNARLGQPEIDLGIVPGWGGTQRLARVCGLGVAKELILTGRPVDAEEALRIGLVNAIADPVLDHALEVAAKLAAKSPVALARREAAAQPLAGRARAGGGGVRRPVRERGREGGPRRLRREAGTALRRQVKRGTRQEDSRRAARSRGPHALAPRSRRSCSRPPPWPPRRPRSPPAAGTRRWRASRSRCARRASTAAPIDAISGPETVAAVRTFQRIHGLPVTGLADARTRARMGPLGRPLFGARTLHRGAFGWDVAVLQFLLVRQGIAVPVNAYFDGPTAHGVRAMQRRLHLQPDGVVGPHTLAALVRRGACRSRGRVAVVAHHTSHHHRQRTLTGSPRRPRGRVALVDRAALPHDGRAGSRASTTSTRATSS